MKSVRIIKENEWLCENHRIIERYAGKCVLLNPDAGRLFESSTIEILLKETTTSKLKGHPFVFHVPSKEELGAPIPVLKKT